MSTRASSRTRGATPWIGSSSNATLVGANAVISMRFDSSEIAGSMSEIVAYGTAVIVEPDASATTAAE